ncbi:hypothetical protein [Bradyrhizobium sp. SYSU BS000235]|uniref:hypothetical protein n=1 Tax=Bradyrhizobium sp. SYSU BS000235 TaxID=3411332 RepID=UPI003C71AECE
MLSPDENKDVKHDDWAMSKGVALGVLSGLVISALLICIAYYFDWSNMRTLVHLVLD